MIETVNPNEREDRNLAVLSHLSAIVGGFIFPFGNVLGPLLMYFSYRDKRPYVSEHAKAILNFQITMTILAVLLTIVGFVIYGVLIVTMVAASPNTNAPPTPASTGALIGIFAMLALFLAFLVWTLVQNILGAIAASKGRAFHYPLTINFVK